MTTILKSNRSTKIPFINLWSVNKTYQNPNGNISVINKLNAKIYRGELILISGAPGSGKTTLGKLIAGIEKPNSGLVQIDGVFINELSPWELAFWRSKNVGFVSKFSTMNRTKTLRENITKSHINLPIFQDQNQRLEDLAVITGLEKQINQPIENFSKEQIKLASTLQALIYNPKVLILDEPFIDMQQVEEMNILIHLIYNLVMNGKTVIVLSKQKDKIYVSREFVLEQTQSD